MSIPKEPFLSSYLEVLRIGISHARGLAIQKGSHEQISDLLDAIHVIPELINNWEKCNEPGLRRFLEEYDNKWANKPNAFSLVKIFKDEFKSLRISEKELKKEV